jgi:hypothetical protein
MFQLLLIVYVLLTGNVPTIVQAIAFGLNGGGSNAFAVAMATAVARDGLLLAPVVMLSRHPLGILHPLIIAVVVWPLLSAVPRAFGDFGGWAGVLAGMPLAAPHFWGIPTRFAPELWMAVAKYNCVEILGLVSTYLGFGLAGNGRHLSRRLARRDLGSLKTVMIGLIMMSVVLLYLFVQTRGGLNEHLTSLGGGRFRELSNQGMVIFVIHIGAIALFVWIAAKPGDVKSPMFLSSMVVIMAGEFIANGSRSSALSVPLTAGLIWALRHHKVPWKVGLVLAPIMFVSIGLLGTVRTSSWSGSTAADAFASTGWSKSFANAQAEIAERRANSASVPVVDRGFEVAGGPLLGRSYAAALAAFIPRPLWKDKPRGAGALYARLFLGAPFEGTTIPLTPEAEMYWNFGYPGVVLISILYGMLLRKVYLFFWRRYPDPFSTVFYALFVTSFQFTTDSMVPFEQHAFLLIVCYFAASIFAARTPYRDDPMLSRLALDARGPLSVRAPSQRSPSADSDSAR